MKQLEKAIRSDRFIDEACWVCEADAVYPLDCFYFQDLSQVLYWLHRRQSNRVRPGRALTL